MKALQFPFYDTGQDGCLDGIGHHLRQGIADGVDDDMALSPQCLPDAFPGNIFHGF